ncbi:HflC protein [Pseudooceanicola batsensis HTCC2597]|uniref:HflC protein n=1 Tax=Pseudooceanicola batsensis (strain ATCC BAA-863 / DSM 15984 / KCTC 12145 / HTCC2597) TaxID=252305 RepID=A3TUL9_PSEBH|nr:protease modulator HflC [Pseudooceanicola batsensis]EAQ04215.1 HflC protein [Pseudooceanicola batsensis HTCC2597]
MKRSGLILILVVVLALVGLNSIFIVDEREKGLVLQFGRVVDVKEDPGLAFKVPIIQEVVRYDDRILSRDIDPLEVTPLDDRRLVVDAFARYRIVDVEQFRQAVGAGGIAAAESRLDSILRSQTREILGSVSSNDILSVDRAALMLRIRNGAIDEAANLGLEIIDVRLKRTDLPRENLDATFARMRAEREREAADEVARGNEAAQRIRAQADRTQVEIVSDANRQADIIRGQADARRNAIFAEAFGADPEFFDFYRSLTAYQRALQDGNSTMVINPNNEFFTYLKNTGAGTSSLAQGGGTPVAAEAPETGSETQAEPEPQAAPESETGPETQAETGTAAEPVAEDAAGAPDAEDVPATQ